MRSDDQRLRLYLAKDMRQIKTKLVFPGGDSITSVQSLDMNTEFGSSIAIGNTVSTNVKVTCETPSFDISGREFTLYFGAIITGDTDVTWTKMGIFRVLPENIENRLGFSTFTAYDRMYTNTRQVYKSTLAYPASMKSILNEICQACSITPPDLDEPSYVNPTVNEDYLTDFTHRDAIGYIASYQGKNAYIDCDGKLQFKWFMNTAYTIDDHSANVPYADEKDVNIQKLIVSTGDDNIQAGNGSDGLIFNNPLMTGERLEEMLPAFENFRYRRLDADIPKGNYLIEPGDILRLSYVKNPMAPTAQQETVYYTAPVMSLSFHYDGGLSCKFSSYGAPDSVMKSISARKFTDHTQFNGLQKEIVHATEQITGASGGYVRINFGDDGKTAEILIMDEPDIKDAKKIWRWNQGGLAHTNDGYDGKYDTAITSDGHIVAKFISGEFISGVGIRTITEDTKSHLDMNKAELTYYANTRYDEHSGEIVSREAVGGIYARFNDENRHGIHMWAPDNNWVGLGSFDKIMLEVRPYYNDIITDADVNINASLYIRKWGGGGMWNISDKIHDLESALSNMFTLIEE